MKTKRRAIAGIVLIGLLIGSLALGALIYSLPSSAAADACPPDDDDAQATAAGELEAECGPEDETGEGAIPAGTGLSADEARAIVGRAHPGTTARAVEFDRENGRDIFEVELDDGREVVVDANSGEILGMETDDSP